MLGGKEGGIEDEMIMLMLFETDADGIGLWANIESAIYKELKNKKAGSHAS